MLPVDVTRSIVTQPTDTGAVLMDRATGNCFELNRVGAAIWKALSEGKSSEVIAAELVETYRVKPEIAAADVETLVSSLVQHGLIDPRYP
jgi:hypothetical protein